MNRLLTMSLMSLSLLTLNGCNSSDSNSGQTNTVYTTDVTKSSCTAYGNPIQSFQRIQMHYGLLSDQAYVAGETGGLLPLTVTADAPAGATTITVDSTTALVTGQLITYFGENFDYYVAEIAGLTSNTITLTQDTALVSKVVTGTNVWNFYNDDSNPNHYGYKALVDLSYRGTASIVSENSKHVIIGDNWLNDTSFTQRLAERFSGSGFVNNTNDGHALCNLLENFETDVTAHNPDYVWINSSINDNLVGVSQEDYKLRMQDLIAKVQGIGATAIVYDAVPGSASNSADGVVTAQMLAYRYSAQVLDLYNATTSTTQPEEPVVVTPPTDTEEPVVVTPPTDTEEPTEPEEPVIVTPPTDTEEPTEPVDPVVVTPPTNETSSCAATAEPIDSFTWVQMHWGLLRSQGFVSSDADLGLAETEGLMSYTVSSDISSGSTTIDVDSLSGLVTGQLVTYLATDGNYRVAQIESLTDTQLTITGVSAVINGIAAGDNLWNFYYDPDHPNAIGSSAIADFGVAAIAGLPGVTDATHVLLGDSWFTNDGFEERVRTRLPNATIVNQSTGGHTLCDLLDKFDTNVSGSAPDYVWINSSVNDYFKDVSQTDFKIRMQNLIAKVQSTGAVAVVFDSAPAPYGTTDSGTDLNTLSRAYAFQVEQLLNVEANQ